MNFYRPAKSSPRWKINLFANR